MKNSGLFCRTAAVFLAVHCAFPAMAAEPDPAVQAATNAKAIAEAERDAAKARLDTAEAEAKLATIEVTLAAKNAEAVATAEKAGFDKDKAAADARTAAIAADQAAIKAKFGSISANGVTPGAVDAGSGAGTPEATILAAKALDVLARQVAASIDQDVIIIAGSTAPQFGNLQLYNFRRTLTGKLFQEANLASSDGEKAFAAFKAKQPARAGAGGTESLGALITGAGAALDAASKVASFFQTAYKFDNLAVSGLTDQVFAVAVAGRIADRKAPKKAYLPGRTADNADTTDLFNELNDLVTRRVASGQNQAAGENALKQLDALLKAAKAAPDKAEIEGLIDLFTRAVAAEKVASKGFDDFVAALAVSEGGKTVIQRVGEEKALSRLTAKNLPLLYVSVSMQGGTSYTRKSIWNFLGAQPFFVSGGIVANWALIATDGQVLKSGVASSHSGFKSVGRIDR